MKLSIITINRNNASGLRKTINSVVNQSFTDYEYIVIDGASTDESVEVIKENAEKIDSWVSEPDKGIYNAMNKGILKATGEYLLFLNSGDLFFVNETLELIFRENFTEDIVYGDVIHIHKNNEQERFYYPEYLSISYLIKHMVCHQAIFHKRSLFFSRMYDENYKIVADWEFLLHVYYLNSCTAKKLNVIVAINDGSGISSDIDKVNKERASILKKYFSEKILADYKYFHDLEFICMNSTLFPFLGIFLKKRKLQRIVKRFMKFILMITNNIKLVPHEENKLVER